MSLDDWIKDKVIKDFSPDHIELVNESYKHAGHAGDDGSGETHYRLLLVADRFAGLGRVERQRLVNASIRAAFDRGLHAVSFKLFAPEEYCV